MKSNTHKKVTGAMYPMLGTSTLLKDGRLAYYTGYNNYSHLTSRQLKELLDLYSWLSS